MSEREQFEIACDADAITRLSNIALATSDDLDKDAILVAIRMLSESVWKRLS